MGRWAARVREEIDVYRQLQDLADSAKDHFVVKMLRQNIFAKTFSSLGYCWNGMTPKVRFARLREIFCTLLVSALFELVWMVLAVSCDWIEPQLVLSTYILSVAFAAFFGEILFYFPRAEWNICFRYRKQKIEMEEKLKQSMEILQESIDMADYERIMKKREKPNPDNL